MNLRPLVLILLVTLTFELPAYTQLEPVGGSRVTEPIDLLKSGDETKRQEGKARLLSRGADSVGPLIALLDDVCRDKFRPWFVPGREEEGKEAWAQYQALDPGNVHGRQVALERLSRLEISSTLKNDSIELLGQLRAKEAIPLLIRIMEDRALDNLWEKMRSEMYALVVIGSSAVIPLIELIRGAEAAARRSSHEVPAYRIQVRAARVLGEIGDSRALPVLTELLKKEKDVMVWRAIEEIKRKNRRK